jgi:hypothetical protein
MDHNDKPPPPLGDRDATLLPALRERYPSDTFDDVNIATAAPGCPALLAALDFLDARIDRRRRALTHRSHEAVAKWIDRVEGVPADGLLLTRDRIGWLRIDAVGRGATGCTGAAG